MKAGRRENVKVEMSASVISALTHMFRSGATTSIWVKGDLSWVSYLLGKKKKSGTILLLSPKIKTE